MYPLLNSLALQQAVNYKDFGVVIVYDGEEATPLPEEEWHSYYPYEIKFVHAPHGGVSAARNHALDNATATYVMFCDADDMFYHACGIRILFDEMNRAEFDTLTTLFIEETRNPQTNEPVFVQHPQDTTFVHGKVHRRQYLLDNNIRWNENLRIHEDSYFNVLCRCVSREPGKVKYLPQGVYLWRWRDNSICREDPDYMLKTYTQLLDSSDALVNELERRGLPDQATFYCGNMVFDTYYELQKPRWLNPAAAMYKRNTELRFKRYLQAHQKLWGGITLPQRMEMSTNIRARYVREGMPMETQTFDSWLKHVKEMK